MKALNNICPEVDMSMFYMDALVKLIHNFKNNE